MIGAFGKDLGNLIKKLITGTTIDKNAVEEILKDMKDILLQSDVDIKLADDLISKIRKRALEEKLPAGITLREHVLKVIYEELVKLLGGKPFGLSDKKRIMLVGLFGSGKTTTVGKLGKYFIKQGLRPAFAGLDYHRPAATDQLIQLGKQIGIPVHVEESRDVYSTAKNALEKFSKYDVLIFDTAGRDALDQQLANELKKLGDLINPDEVLLVIPADLGKVARQQAEEFHRLVGVTGVIITKMDGTAKAGSALAATSVTGAKVKFIGVGEKIEEFELYDPTRFVSRLLGLGDLQTLLEKAKEVEIKKESVEKIAEGKFTLQDFYEQLKAMQSMGPLSQLAGMIPGMGMMKLPEGALEKQEQKLKNYKYIIESMTKEEREYPEIISSKRIARIAKGSGRSEAEVRELLNQYSQMKRLFKTMGGIKGLQRGALKNLSKQFGFKF